MFLVRTLSKATFAGDASQLPTILRKRFDEPALYSGARPYQTGYHKNSRGRPAFESRLRRRRPQYRGPYLERRLSFQEPSGVHFYRDETYASRVVECLISLAVTAFRREVRKVARHNRRGTFCQADFPTLICSTAFLDPRAPQAALSSRAAVSSDRPFSATRISRSAFRAGRLPPQYEDHIEQQRNAFLTGGRRS
jgi:hypothetical protein